MCTHFFFSRRAEIPDFLQNVRRTLEQNLHHLDAARLLFGSERIIDSIESFGDAIRFAQRTLAEKKSNSVRVARRNSGNFAILP